MAQASKGITEIGARLVNLTPLLQFLRSKYIWYTALLFFSIMAGLYLATGFSLNTGFSEHLLKNPQILFTLLLWSIINGIMIKSKIAKWINYPIWLLTWLLGAIFFLDEDPNIKILTPSVILLFGAIGIVCGIIGEITYIVLRRFRTTRGT